MRQFNKLGGVLISHMLKLYHLTNWMCLSPREYCEKYAKPENIGAAPEEKSSDEELSEDNYESSDEAVAGQADP